MTDTDDPTDKVVPFQRVDRTQRLPEPQPGTRSRATLNFLTQRGPIGATWIDIAAVLGVSHGSASAVLSRLHQQGAVHRLTVRRDGCAVYVLPDHTEGRVTVSPKVQNQGLLDEMAAMLRRYYRPCKHLDFVEDRCQSCNTRRLLEIYDQRRSSN